MAPSIEGIELGTVLGRGASSIVYEGVQQPFGRTVAVKVLRVPGRDDVAARLFATECRTLGRLASHPAIVTVFDAGTTDEGDPYLVMEHLPGGTLADRIRDVGPMPVDEVLPIAVRLAGALATAHGGGIVHGDVKPQNVLWSAADEPALADFGVARLLSTTTATTGLSVFTPLHAAPELFDGQGPGVRSDVFGLGSTVFELLDGRPAAGDEGDSPLSVVGRVARGETRRLDRSSVPDVVVDVVERAMAPDPDDRYATAAELGEACIEAERALGATPTRMVVIELADLPDGAGRDTSSEASTGAEPPAPSADTILPARSVPSQARVRAPDWEQNVRGRRGPGRRWLPVALGVLAVVVAITVGVTVTRGGDETDAAAGTTSTTPAPHSTVEGLQPDVTYNVTDAANTSPALDRSLADIGAIVAPLGPGVTELNGLPRLVNTTPATVRYQAYNPAKPPGCVGFLSRPMTLTGQWAKIATTSDGAAALLTVLQFATDAQADEAYVAWSLGQSPSVGSCSGFRMDWGVADYDALAVSEQQVPLTDLPDGVRYNSYEGLAHGELAIGQYTYSLTGVAQRGRTIVAFGIGTTEARGRPDPTAAAALVSNVFDRIG